MAMIRSRAASGSSAPFRLLYSVREPAAILYHDELEKRFNQDRAITLAYAYTRAAPQNWPRLPGRIDAALIADATWPSKLQPTCYVCGPTPFVEIAAGFLSACGNNPDRIKTERFGPTGEQK
jgi:ferredoxin-NADP reductase